MRHRPYHSQTPGSPTASLPISDDADVAAGFKRALIDVEFPDKLTLPTAVPEEEIVEHVDVLGFDISHMTRRGQFVTCSTGVFVFTLGYGFLQELIAVHLCFRKLGLFLAMCQFAGYSFWSFILRNHVDKKRRKSMRPVNVSKRVPLEVYLGISLLRATDLGMTNMAMQYINYPAKTLMKSSRVVWTMLFGVIIAGKKYRGMDYAPVVMMSVGLVIFMKADATSAAVFQPLGVILLTGSLICDGANTNFNEAVMRKYNIGQDEFIFKIYSIALVVITVAAYSTGELSEGIKFLSVNGTLEELEKGLDPTWTVGGKMTVMLLFSTLGFFGSSCSAAITKNFGALTMSITSTARKATTVFLSFALFPNTCTPGHVVGIVIFIISLFVKSLRAGRRSDKRTHRKKQDTAPLSTGSMGSTGSETECILRFRRTESAAYLIV